MSFTVVVVDPHEASREGLALLLERAGCRVAATVATTAGARALIDRLSPDVVLVDADGAGRVGIELAEAIRHAPSCPGVVLYATDDRAPAIEAARHAGVLAVALKHSSVSDLLEILGAAAAATGRPQAAVGTDVLTPPSPAPALSVLSRRESEILELLADGLTGEGIAQSLVLSAETVKTHIRNAMLKLEASTRVHAIAIAIRHGYISSLGPSAIARDSRPASRAG